MILLDFSQIAISNASVIQSQNDGALVLETLRFQIINSIRMYHQRFKKEFGEMIICCDGNNYWRCSIFEHYKGWRKALNNDPEHKLKSDDLFQKIDLIRDELKTLFPFKLIRFDNLEADDVIAILALYIERDSVIISADKDFQQLHKDTQGSRIKQYSPLKKEFIVCESPRMFLKEMIIRGDKGDGIPNIFGSDDSLMMKVRQKSIRHTDIEKWLYSKPEDFCPSYAVLSNYRRNKSLIAFSEIPEEYKNRVLSELSNQMLNHQSEIQFRGKLKLYFEKHEMNQFSQKIDEFF